MPLLLVVALVMALGACARERASTTSREGEQRGFVGAALPPPRAVIPAPPDAADGGLLARKLPHIQYRGGPFLRHPRVVTITFANDDPALVGRLERFGGVTTRSPWWHAVTDGYCGKPGDCIGDGSGGASLHIDETPPARLRDSDVESLLRRLAQAGRLDPSDGDALWLVYLPAGVALTDGTTTYCTGKARAFHRSLEIGRVRVPFAVLPRCGDESALTGSASHELLEATTNPFPSERGFAFLPGSGPSGFSAAGLEPVDPCGLVTMDDHFTTESGFVVQRAWSNGAAAAGLDPCVPARPGRPYVMLVPREPAVRLAHEGDTAVVDLDATAVGAPPAWSISAFDLSGYQDHEQYVDLSLDKAVVVAGETAKLSLRARKKNPSQVEIVALVSTLGVHSHMWPLLVMMR